MYSKFLPKKAIEGKRGYYPVTSHAEWEELPAVYKAMEWFPKKLTRYSYGGKVVEEMSFPRNVIFDCPYIEPYGVSGKVSVSIEEVQKILFCYFGKTECHLYTLCEVEFDNGVRYTAKWYQDSRTGAYAIQCGDTYVGKQGGFQGFVPARIEETESGFEYKQGYQSNSHRCCYQYSNPFKK